MTQPAHVLIADDVADIREIIGFQLRFDGYRTAEAENGREVLDAVHVSRPDVLLLDLDMPDVDGWSVLKELRRDPDAAGMHVAVLTGDSNEMVEQRAMSAGAEAYIAKPVTGADVARAVDRMLGVASRVVAAVR